jgi:hypothetical protein
MQVPSSSYLQPLHTESTGRRSRACHERSLCTGTAGHAVVIRAREHAVSCHNMWPNYVACEYPQHISAILSISSNHFLHFLYYNLQTHSWLILFDWCDHKPSSQCMLTVEYEYESHEMDSPGRCNSNPYHSHTQNMATTPTAMQVGLGLGECIASGLRKMDGPQAKPWMADTTDAHSMALACLGHPTWEWNILMFIRPIICGCVHC